MTRWLATHEVDGEVRFRVGTDGPEHLVAEWVGTARLVALRDGTLVRFDPVPTADARTVAKIERGGVGMLFRHLQDGLSLHAAAIAIDGRAILLMGPSGMGKSTLAAWLVAHAGARLLSDDLTPIECDSEGKWNALPLESDHWLDDRAAAALAGRTRATVSHRSKEPHAASLVAEHPTPLLVVVDLAFHDASTERSLIAPIDALGLLLRNSVRFEIDNAHRQQRELDQLASLAETVSFVRLSRPRSFDELAATGEGIAAWLREGRVTI